MKFNKLLIALGACIVIICFLCFILMQTTIVVDNKTPDYFSDADISAGTLDFSIVNTPKDAVNIAKTAIKNIYHESALQHNRYYVYFDSNNNWYYVTASGRWFFHASVSMIINKKDGAILYIMHGKA